MKLAIKLILISLLIDRHAGLRKICSSALNAQLLKRALMCSTGYNAACNMAEEVSKS